MKIFRLLFMASMLPIFCILSACKETSKTMPVDITIELLSNSGGSRSYISTNGNKSDMGTMESSGNTFADFKVKYQYIIVSSSNDTIEMLIDLKLIQKNVPDQYWKSTLQIPHVSTVSFEPFKDLSVKITGNTSGK